MSVPQSARRTLAHVGNRLQNGARPILRGNGCRPLTTHRSMTTKGAVAIMPVSKRLRYAVGAVDGP